MFRIVDIDDLQDLTLIAVKQRRRKDIAAAIEIIAIGAAAAGLRLT